MLFRSRPAVRRDARTGQRHDVRVAIGVIRMAVGVDDQGHGKVLGARPFDKRLWRVRRIDQDALGGHPIAEEITEVAIAARADLFEDEPRRRRRTLEGHDAADRSTSDPPSAVRATVAASR